MRQYFREVFLILVYLVISNFAQKFEHRCSADENCLENQICKDHVCECDFNTFKLGNTCVKPRSLKESCFNRRQCTYLDSYSYCNTEGVCECQLNTYLKGGKCYPTKDYVPPPEATASTRQIKQPKIKRDISACRFSGTVGMLIMMGLVTIMLAAAIVYSIIKLKKGAFRSHNKYCRNNNLDDYGSEDCKYPDFDPPPIYEKLPPADALINKQ